MSERKCELPTVHEIMATCILTYKASGRVLYSEASVCGSFEAATTYGLTSMCLANQFDCPVCVGYRYVEDLFEFNCTAINLGYSGLTVGAGGKVNL
jgi:hypothetical protein